jgi:probable F420-dependent oxidoreductase
VKLGILCFMTGYSVSPAELARVAEDAGFESVWTGDHSHVPVTSNHGPPIDTRSGKPVPVHYSELLDPFLALTHAAAVTSKIKLGTGICLVPQRDVITTAKSVATLDCLSGGRFIFGVGAGWNEQEMRDHGTDPGSRRTRLKESVEAMKEIWTSEVAEYRGSLVGFGPMLCGPKPRQSPHPPVLLGGNHHNIDRVVDFADGWLPSTTVDPDRAFLGHIPELQKRASAAGRGRLPVTAIHVTDVDALADGHSEFTEADLGQFETAGVDRAVLIIPPGRDAALGQIDRYSRLIGH